MCHEVGMFLGQVDSTFEVGAAHHSTDEREHTSPRRRVPDGLASVNAPL